MRHVRGETQEQQMSHYKSVIPIAISTTMVFVAIFAITMTIIQGRDFFPAIITLSAAVFSVLWCIETRRNLVNGDKE